MCRKRGSINLLITLFVLVLFSLYYKEKIFDLEIQLSTKLGENVPWTKQISPSTEVRLTKTNVFKKENSLVNSGYLAWLASAEFVLSSNFVRLKENSWNPKEAKKEQCFMALYVLSKPLDFKARQAVRLTWGSEAKKTKRIQLRFVIGIPDENKGKWMEKALQEEFYTHQDLVRVTSLDNYRNIPQKVAHSMNHFLQQQHQQQTSSSSFCKYFAKVDIDTYVRVPQLLFFLERKVLHLSNNVYGGNIYSQAKAVTDRKNIWYIGDDIVKNLNETNDGYFPKYAAGYFYFLSFGLVKRLVDSGCFSPHQKISGPDEPLIGICVRNFNDDGVTGTDDPIEVLHVEELDYNCRNSSIVDNPFMTRKSYNLFQRHEAFLTNSFCDLRTTRSGIPEISWARRYVPNVDPFDPSVVTPFSSSAFLKPHLAPWEKKIIPGKRKKDKPSSFYLVSSSSSSSSSSSLTQKLFPEITQGLPALQKSRKRNHNHYQALLRHHCTIEELEKDACEVQSLKCFSCDFSWIVMTLIKNNVIFSTQTMLPSQDKDKYTLGPLKESQNCQKFDLVISNGKDENNCNVPNETIIELWADTLMEMARFDNYSFRLLVKNHSQNCTSHILALFSDDFLSKIPILKVNDTKTMLLTKKKGKVDDFQWFSQVTRIDSIVFHIPDFSSFFFRKTIDYKKLEKIFGQAFALIRASSSMFLPLAFKASPFSFETSVFALFGNDAKVLANSPGKLPSDFLHVCLTD